MYPFGGREAERPVALRAPRAVLEQLLAGEDARDEGLLDRDRLEPRRVRQQRRWQSTADLKISSTISYK